MAFNTYDNNLKLVEMIAEINAKIKDAEEFAKANDLTFYMDFGYGSGACYEPIDTTELKRHGIDYSSVAAIDGCEVAYAWYSSTMSCM